MSLDEEAQHLEQTMVGRARKITNVGELRQVLRQSLAAYEKAVDALPREDREEALSLYLDRIRKVTFGFHIAILRLSARRRFRSLRNPTRDLMREHVDQHDDEMHRVARIYRFL